MLQLKNIVKTYEVGDNVQTALKGISLNFRDNEFVAILGQSGSGKTTMLNIIGGLDRYSSGDLIINGVSTKKYKDSDWDIYRNNKIGFVFQSYNLIPHQSVLANVEMALTLSGIGKKERKERAIDVLNKVGLSEHIYKKPNQMSGGQMQRVAIARALINNPDILMADEPTGALDSSTSIQIMDLLKKIAEDKLVIMVTHNPELAKKYATRTVNLLDGEIVGDTNPFEDCSISTEPQRQRKVSMSFATALSLSFNNLKTKIGRTLLTAFAGSIGIIGIALILSLSTGMNKYINDIQRETMASYPITISSETIDTSSFLNMRTDVVGELHEDNDSSTSNGIHVSYFNLETSEAFTSSITENNLTKFKQYLDDPESEIKQYIGENGIIYNYNIKFDVFSHDLNGDLVDSDSEAGKDNSIFGSNDDSSQMFSSTSMMNPASMMKNIMGNQSAVNFSEIMSGPSGETVNTIISDSYEMLYGDWPHEYNEVLLILNRNNSLSAEVMYQLGFITDKQYKDAEKAIKDGKTAPDIVLDYDEACEHIFYVIPACDRYIENDNGTFTYIEDPVFNEKELLKDAVELKICGIVKPIEDADNANILTPIGYSYKLTEYVIDHTAQSAVINAQLKTPKINVLNGVQFEPSTEEEKIENAKNYVSSLGISEKASLYQLIMYYSQSSAPTEAGVASSFSGMQMPPAGSTNPSGETEIMPNENTFATMLDVYLSNDPDPKLMLALYDRYIGDASFDDNMEAFGHVTYDTPSSVNIYTDNFENKDSISTCIEHYNESVDKDSRITYTDYVALLTSSLTTIINGISYFLIAFVAISLVVSCIMIGIITHISVMERTKEIGILRALGASKSNISQVFNAETFIIGCCAGVLGIGVSSIALIPLNSIIEAISGIEDLNAILPAGASVILIILSIIITVIGGLLPAKNAAKKDPVVALRTE